ncbi:hypothetical protein [Brachybacterium sp. FME24]|uniref:hypothetical protein n=1 Tax=Brachybacterium sp. FME24 TaxID=2742605 RepID=UPI001865B612|nr:hypothetical protein [Brachybacterium sp. FME24]
MSQPPAGPASLAPQVDFPVGPSATAGDLRRPALAVTILAVLVLLARSLHQVLMLAEGAASAMYYIVQAFYLVTGPLSVLLAAAVIWLLQRARRPNGHIGLRPLLAFALLVILELLAPVWTAVFGVLDLVPVMSGAPGSMSTVVSALSLLGDLALTLAIGIIGALVLVQPSADRREIRIPLTPGVLVVVLLVLAVVSLTLIPITGLVNSTLGYSSTAGSLIGTGVGTLASLAQALLVPVAGLLVAVTTGRLRLLAWVALGVTWLSWIAVSLTIRIMIFQLMASPGVASAEVWGLLRGIVQGLGAFGVAVIAVLLLVLLLRRRGSSSTPDGNQSAHSLAPPPIH